MINVAIDGPVGAGKSSVARECAKRLGIIYVDTGALYRSCALFCVRNNVDISPENEQAVSELLNSKLDLSIKLEDGTQRVIVNGEDVSDEIRTLEISRQQVQFPHFPLFVHSSSVCREILLQRTALSWTEEISVQ